MEIGNAYKTIFTEGFTNWQISLQCADPACAPGTWIRNIAQQKIQKQQTLMNRRSQEQSIQVEIRNAVQKAQDQPPAGGTRQRCRQQLHKEQLDGEVKRFDAGLSENFRVLDRQNQLALAENTDLVNLINYKKSIIALQKAMYTLLESNEFEIAKSSSGNVPDLK